MRPATRAAWAALLLLAPGAAGAQRVQAVGPVALTVSDMDRALRFYTEVLPFRVVADTVVGGVAVSRLQGIPTPRLRAVTLALGDETLRLLDWPGIGRPVPADSRSNDLWFQHVAIIVSDMDRAYAALAAHGVEHISTAPQLLPAWNPNAGGISAFYFRDPDGHALEILHFPPGKGDPKWQRHGGRLFLGIDHTAIAVGDTERSLAFYRDRLGFRVAGESLNHGPEQERLNNVAGARVRITALRAPSGPGIEFLEYLTPRDARPAPALRQADDLAHWQTVVTATDLDALLRQLRAAGAEVVSPGVVDLPDRALGFARSMLLRDPDGHAVQLVAP